MTITLPALMSDRKPEGRVISEERVGRAERKMRAETEVDGLCAVAV